MADIKKILITKEGKKFYVKDPSSDLHTQFGLIKKEDLIKGVGEKVISNTNKKFTIIEPNFMDIFKKIKRDAQIIPLKDVGTIISETGINSNSKVVDSGSGSGALSCLLANLVKEVTTYEIREDFVKIVEHNIELLGLKNIKIKNKDVYQGIDEKNVDLVTLDLPEPWKALDSASSALKVGGFLVSYSPSIPQVMDMVSSIIKREEFIHIKTIEIIEREWEVNERKVRPKSKILGHSGFLSISRRI